jgi:hypothetical protein
MGPPESGISFPQKLWKSLWKRSVLNSQISDIHGLVALCTYFVQIPLTHKSQIIAVFNVGVGEFLGLL